MGNRKHPEGWKAIHVIIPPRAKARLDAISRYNRKHYGKASDSCKQSWIITKGIHMLYGELAKDPRGAIDKA